MRRLGLFFFCFFFCFFLGGGGGGGGGSQFRISIFLGGFQNNEYFLGYEYFGDIFGGSSQNWTISRGHFYAFRVFSEGQDTEWMIYLGVAKISNIYLGCLKFLIFF